ncbi:MAG: phosphoenolpyruvate synthase/pyruvate phosphate dikinase [Deltaproteobacteria bacterium]|nr:MAG: phosphoenolpyruvate synthase/pyruvate phosphate dikinase [Deltaproteobacteria bacterium]
MVAKEKVPEPAEFYPRFKAFHELMANKIREILLVSSPYDAFILEEDTSLASQIINEYRGLNLSQPPRITRTASAREALKLLKQKTVDMVIAMPHLEDMDAFTLSLEIKKINASLPVILLAHSIRSIYPLPESMDCTGVDKIFIWSGNSDLLLALVKNAEDSLNVDHDTRRAMVRVLILVEDSPVYYSSFLPLIYKEIVKQTQEVLQGGLNEEHRLLLMRARPKILLARTYEEAVGFCEKYKDYLFGVISDTRLPRQGRLDDNAGFEILTRIKKEIPDLPLLLMSSESGNMEVAARIPAAFIDKNSPNLIKELHEFFLTHLGFGEFVFRLPDGTEIDRAADLHELEIKVAGVPDESLLYHAQHNHFSRWIMARSEFTLASTIRQAQTSDFESVDEIRQYLVSMIHGLRKWRQKGVVAQFSPNYFDPEVMDFVKIGSGSLGGKARGLAFMSALLYEQQELHEKYHEINILIPKTLVICTDGFESFVEENDLKHFSQEGYSDEEIRENFLKGRMPEWLLKHLEVFLKKVTYPVSVRSSSLLEDAHFQPFAGIYKTYMIPNNHPDFRVRLRHLVTAIKLVYASTYYESAKSYSRTISVRPQEEAMAVIIQQLVGQKHGDFFYPTIGGVAQSYNFYPVGPMKPEDGIASIALGFGKTVVEGEKSLRFCPRYPQVTPQFSNVDDILENAQRSFYALRVRNYPERLQFEPYSNLEKRQVDEAEAELPVKLLSGTYISEEHRIRDSGFMPGPKVLTFAPILKHGSFPLPDLLMDLIYMGRRNLGCPIEIEFSVNLAEGRGKKGDFFFLQIRPMAFEQERFNIIITEEEEKKAICRCTQALGVGVKEDIRDVVFVKPDVFSPDATQQIAQEIRKINSSLVKQKNSYLLIGPGRWGSADPWLGIPVNWKDISGVCAIVELRYEKLKADPSQGSHFFLNITSLGIHYLTVTEGSGDHLDWDWLNSQPVVEETTFLKHIKAEHPLMVKIDSKKSKCVIIPKEEDANQIDLSQSCQWWAMK